MSWAGIWTFFFFMSLGIFTCLAVVVTIGGFFNIRSLFKDLARAREKAQDAGQADSE
jgi:hypothetical protein